MFPRAVLLGVVLSVASSTVAYAQGPGAPQSRQRRTALWTVIGAGAGFGLGLWAGLHVFDDAVNSERKIWTTAAGSAAAGAFVAHIVARPRPNGAARPARTAAMRPVDTPPAPFDAEWSLRPEAREEWRAFRAALRSHGSRVERQ